MQCVKSKGQDSCCEAGPALVECVRSSKCRLKGRSNAMSELKTRSTNVADAEPADSGRAEWGAGVIVAVLACVLILMLLVGGGVIGFVTYSHYRQQLIIDQTR